MKAQHSYEHSKDLAAVTNNRKQSVSTIISLIIQVSSSKTAWFGRAAATEINPSGTSDFSPPSQASTALHKRINTVWYITFGGFSSLHQFQVRTDTTVATL